MRFEIFRHRFHEQSSWIGWYTAERTESRDVKVCHDARCSGSIGGDRGRQWRGGHFEWKRGSDLRKKQSTANEQSSHATAHRIQR